jgi:hypothetical protein
VGEGGGKRVEQVDKGGNGRKRSRVGKDDGIFFRSTWPILVFREEGPNSRRRRTVADEEGPLSRMKKDWS